MTTNVEEGDYDPYHDVAERRGLRRQYRKLIDSAENEKQNLIIPSSEGLCDQLNDAETLFRKVKTTREAVLDSKFLVLSSNLAAEKAKNVPTSFGALNIEELLGSFKGFLNAKSNSLHSLGERFSNYLQRAPQLDFMFGPLMIEQRQKERKVSERTRLEIPKDGNVLPQLSSEAIERQENETSKNVEAVYRFLAKYEPVNFFEFLLNPESFSESVENIFYFAFLVRDNKVRIYIDEETGAPLVQTVSQGIEKNKVSVSSPSSSSRKQMIVELTMPEWEQLINLYQITSPMIPTRMQSK